MNVNFRLPLDIKEKVKINIENIDSQIRKMPKVWFLRSRKKETEFIDKISPHINKLNELRKKYPCGEFSALYNAIFNKIDTLNLKNPPKRINDTDSKSNAFLLIKDKMDKSEQLCKDVLSIINDRKYLKEHQEISISDLNKASQKCKKDLAQIEEISKDYDRKISEINQKVNGDSEKARKIIEGIKKFNEEKNSAVKAINDINNTIKEAKSNIFKADRIYSMSNSLKKTISLLHQNCENGQAYSTELISSSNGVLTMAENVKQEIEKEANFLDDVVGGKQIQYNRLDLLKDSSSKSVDYLKNYQEIILKELI